MAEHQLALGLILHTRKLSITITREFRMGALDLIRRHWHKGRKQFTAIEVLWLVGKLGCLAEAAPWSRHQVSRFYLSIALALAQNKTLLQSSSPKFQQLVKSIKSNKPGHDKDHDKHVRFAPKQAARMVHHSDV